MFKAVPAAAVLAILLTAAPALAVPPVINYQARLTDSLGQPVTTTRTMTLTFWSGDAGASGATQLGGGWSDTKQICPDANGLYTILIGSDPGNPIPSSVFSTDAVWLNINVAGEDLEPRKRVSSTPFGVRADYATSASLAVQATQADQADVALSVPASGSVDAGAVKSGTMNDARIPATIARVADVNASLAQYQKFSWSHITGVSAQMQPNCGYLANNAALVTLTLPPSASLAVGDLVRVSGTGAGGWKLAQNASQKILLSGLSVTDYSGSWMPRDSARSWWGVASSSDGSRLAACGGQIYTSFDYGASWSPSGFSSGWNVASSSDGSRLVAGTNGGQIYTSSDYGATWTPRDSNRSWYGVASCAGGSHLVACVNGGQLYTSSDYGANWTPRDSSRSWASVASSADGSRLVACVDGGQIYTSADYGVSWVARAGSSSWASVASSSDGRRLVACVYGGQIYTSSDYGMSWVAHGSGDSWTSVASSADGSRLVACVWNGRIYTSSDCGTTWAPRDSNRRWQSVACSADGTRLVASVSSGQIYTLFAPTMTQTSAGTAGFVTGEQYSTLELQYSGSDTFLPLSREGALGAN